MQHAKGLWRLHLHLVDPRVRKKIDRTSHLILRLLATLDGIHHYPHPWRQKFPISKVGCQDLQRAGIPSISGSQSAKKMGIAPTAAITGQRPSELPAGAPRWSSISWIRHRHRRHRHRDEVNPMTDSHRCSTRLDQFNKCDTMTYYDHTLCSLYQSWDLLSVLSLSLTWVTCQL